MFATSNWSLFISELVKLSPDHRLKTVAAQDLNLMWTEDIREALWWNIFITQWIFRTFTNLFLAARCEALYTARPWAMSHTAHALSCLWLLLIIIISRVANVMSIFHVRVISIFSDLCRSMGFKHINNTHMLIFLKPLVQYCAEIEHLFAKRHNKYKAHTNIFSQEPQQRISS